VNREVLCRPFAPEAIKQRQGAHRKTFSYVDVASVIDRLNEGCDAWSFDVVSHEVYEDEVVVLGRLTADGVVKMAFGTAELTRDRDGHLPSKGDALKAASSDALKKAASLLGVGLEFYRKEAAPEELAVPTNLTIARGYVKKLLENAKVVKYLAAKHGDVLTEFQRIQEMATLEG
jgi:hypothetical protein